MTRLSERKSVLVFLAFAFAYFLSTLVRAITATLAPTLAQEFALNARDLGLLAGGYFLGFAATQIPLGAWLDRFGPKRMVLVFMAVAVAGSLAFSQATGFAALWAARAMTGVGVSACLMAPLTGYRRWYAPANQMRANSWMLMVGAFGMVASTLPVQWLLPVIGWRAIFILLAVMVALAMALIAWQVPGWQPARPHLADAAATPGYAEVWANPFFRSMVPLGFFSYGGLVAMQTLWAGPWLVKVAGYSPLQAAAGMFWLNVAMLVAYWLWGWANPGLTRRGLTAERLIKLGLPASFVMLAILVTAGGAISTGAVWLWTLYCVAGTAGALAQPAVGLAFRNELAGRALSAFNLVIFCGVFTVQWGVGLLIDSFKAAGWAEASAYQGAMAVYGLCCVVSYLYLWVAKRP
jgi:predicted MFS family arabinose efflux permease